MSNTTSLECVVFSCLVFLQVDDVYVEVEEHDYQALNDDADFVEDDDNAGYIDDGMGNDEEEFSDEYDQADQKSSEYYTGLNSLLASTHIYTPTRQEKA